MQKIINVLSITAFVISASTLGSIVYVYANKDKFIDNAKASVLKNVESLVRSQIKSALPDLGISTSDGTSSFLVLPSSTGPAIPLAR